MNSTIRISGLRCIKAFATGAILLALALPVLCHEKPEQTYDLHGTVVELGTSPLYAGWVTVSLRKYTIKSPDRTYVVVGSRHAKPLQVGQNVDFRIQGKSIFIRSEVGKEMKFGLAEETLNADAASNPPAER